MSDNPPGSPTSWWPAVFVVLALVYGLGAPTLINLDECEGEPGKYLVLSLVMPLVPLSLAAWGASAWMAGTAYEYLAGWTWWTLGACAVVTAGGAMWRWWTMLRSRKA